MRILYFFVLLLFVASSQAKGVDERILLGEWCAGSRNDSYEYFKLAIENGKHKFYSWLHERPDTFGTWDLSNNTLTITDDTGFKDIYTVENASPRKLTLHKKGEVKEIYVRNKCIEFEEPPTE